MIGIAVTKESALRVLKQLETELKLKVQEAARLAMDGGGPGAVPSDNFFGLWVAKLEEQMITLEAIREDLLAKLPATSTIRKAEVEAPPTPTPRRKVG